MSNCRKCSHPVSGKFCSQCGLQHQLPRINKVFIINELSNILNFEYGIFHTIKSLFLRPGPSIKLFLQFDRKSLTKPILFLVICSLFYAFVETIFPFEMAYHSEAIKSDGKENVVSNWVVNNYSYSNLIIAFFMACFMKLFFYKQDYTFFEFLVALCFAIGNAMLIIVLFGTLDYFLQSNAFIIGILISLIYTIWAVSTIFEGNQLINMTKMLLVYLISYSLLNVCVYLLDQLIFKISH